MNGPFTLDKANGKVMGVCAGLADKAGADVTLIRLAGILSVFVLGPVAILLYLVAGFVAPARGCPLAGPGRAVRSRIGLVLKRFKKNFAHNPSSCPRLAPFGPAPSPQRVTRAAIAATERRGGIFRWKVLSWEPWSWSRRSF
ncbi:MAG TPA: PspC domain-containing protein [Allosphingosinicella sp.]